MIGFNSNRAIFDPLNIFFIDTTLTVVSNTLAQICDNRNSMLCVVTFCRLYFLFTTLSVTFKEYYGELYKDMYFPQKHMLFNDDIFESNKN